MKAACILGEPAVGRYHCKSRSFRVTVSKKNNCLLYKRFPLHTREKGWGQRWARNVFLASAWVTEGSKDPVLGLLASDVTCDGCCMDAASSCGVVFPKPLILCSSRGWLGWSCINENGPSIAVFLSQAFLIPNMMVYAPFSCILFIWEMLICRNKVVEELTSVM